MFSRCVLGVIAAVWACGTAGAQYAAQAIASGPLTTASSAIYLSPAEIDHLGTLPREAIYLDAFRERLEQVMARQETVGLAVAVLEQGEPVLVFVGGEEEAGSGRPIRRDTLFRAASVSKGMSATLLAILEHEGRLDLSQPVPNELLPLPRGRQANALQLLSMRTGLPSHAMDRQMEGGQNVSLLRQRLDTLRPACAPGECYTYQNVAYASLEVIAAQAAGLEFSTALRAYLFDRVGMRNATVGADAMRASDSWARPHRRRDRDDDGNPRAGDPETVYDSVPAAASVNVSIDDMIAWAQAQLGTSGLLPQSVLDRVHTPQGETPSQTRRLYRLSERIDSTWYALGWRVYDWNGQTLLTHSGYLSGYGAQIYMEPETGFAYVGLWNMDGDAPWWLFPTLMDLRMADGPADWLDQLDED